MDHYPSASKNLVHDPRMRGFRQRATVQETLDLIDRRVTALAEESVTLSDSFGRVLARPVSASTPVPSFDRAAMDGFAVRGEETFSASGFSPAVFRTVGRSRPGCGFDGMVEPGEAVEIATGAPMPAGADAVAPVEISRIEANSLLVTEAVVPGRHVGRAGEDLQPGARVLESGRLLRPQDLGVLSALGFSMVSVIAKPRVAILVTGEEILPAGSRSQGFQIADMNSPMLAGLVDRDGGLARVIGPLPDDRARLTEELSAAVRSADMVMISGGSSTGPEDHAATIVAELGEILIHGIAIRPASPAGIGFVGSVPIALMPGNPVSCLCAYDYFAGRIVRRLAGRSPGWTYRSLVLPLKEKLVSSLGRVDYARVRIVDDRVMPIAISGASILSSVTRADGFVVVPHDREGYPAGSPVEVWLYD